MKIALFFILLQLTFFTSAQESTSGDIYDYGMIDSYGDASLVVSFNPNNKIKGSRYLLDDWGEAYLVINDSILSFQKKFQFDLTTGNLLLPYKKNSKAFIVNDSKVTGFIIKNDYELVIKNAYYVRKSKEDFKEPYDLSSNFFLSIGGSFKSNSKNFLIREDIKYVHTPTATHGYSGEKEAEYKKKKRYYLLNKDGKYVKIRLRKKNILNELKDQEKKLKKYTKKYKLKLNNEKDVLKLLSYYHSL